MRSGLTSHIIVIIHFPVKHVDAQDHYVQMNSIPDRLYFMVRHNLVLLAGVRILYIVSHARDHIHYSEVEAMSEEVLRVAVTRKTRQSLHIL